MSPAINPDSIRYILSNLDDFVDTQADDPLSKGLSVSGLELRLRYPNGVYDADEVPEGFEAVIGGVLLNLTPVEGAILHYLVRHSDRPVSQDELAYEITGTPYGEYDSKAKPIAGHVHRIRAILGSRPSGIETIRGKGYHWVGIES